MKKLHYPVSSQETETKDNKREYDMWFIFVYMYSTQKSFRSDISRSVLHSGIYRFFFWQLPPTIILTTQLQILLKIISYPECYGALRTV